MYQIDFFSAKDEVEWDLLCERSHKATFLHTRKFINYHKERFHDRSVVVKTKNKIIAVLPAATLLKDDSRVISHPGITYAGVITDSSLYGEGLIEVLSLIINFYKSNGFSSILYKATPSTYHLSVDEDELYALHRLGAKTVRVDINAILDIKNRLKVSTQRKRSYKKAIKEGVSLSSGFDYLGDFYRILLNNLEDKHNALPVHTYDELIDLASRFPNHLELSVAKNNNGEVISAVLYFLINNVKHAQYISSSAEGYEKGGLDFIFERTIEEMKHTELEYLSFGTSNEDGGRVLNNSLFRFKRQFGAGSVAHKFYEVTMG